MKYLLIPVFALFLASNVAAQDKTLMKSLTETVSSLSATQQEQVLAFAKGKGDAKAKNLKKAMKSLSLADQQSVVAYAQGVAHPTPMAQLDTKPTPPVQTPPANNGTLHAPMKETPVADKPVPLQKSAPVVTAEEGVQTPPTTTESSQNIQDVSAQKTAQLAPAATLTTGTPNDGANIPQYIKEAEMMPKTNVQWNEEVFDFGAIKANTKVEHDFRFKNTGTVPLKITYAKASCGCTTPAWSQEPIAPGAEGFVRISFDSTGKVGPQTKTVSIWHNGNPITKVLRFTGNVAQ